MITGLDPACPRRMWMVGSLEDHPSPSPSPQVPTHTFLAAAFSPLSSAGPFVSGSAYVLFILSPLSLLLCPSRFFFFLVYLWSPVEKKNRTRTLCIVAFGHLLLASFSSPSSSGCPIGISRLRHSSPRRGPPPPRSRRLPQRILSLGVAPRPAIDSDRAILSWANGRSHPKIKRSSRLLLGSAWAGRTGVVPLSGPRSSRRARDLIMCPCTS